jgi:hypothetical protein
MHRIHIDILVVHTWNGSTESDRWFVNFDIFVACEKEHFFITVSYIKVILVVNYVMNPDYLYTVKGVLA